jgi:8-oxo-dGTP pyrophosphatase MutT (NUDIX family)
VPVASGTVGTVSDGFDPATVPVRPAATVMLVRDGDDGLEVFMLRRTLSAAFASGMYVFPGGRVDDADHADELEPVCDGLDDERASRLLQVERGGLAFWVAAIRECFEEAGVLLARPTDAADPGDVVRFDDPDVAARFGAERLLVHAGERSLVDVCADEDLVLVTDSIHYVSHWITPIGEARRFDTRFFVARAPQAQEPLHDDNETIDSLWVRPAAALERFEAGELALLPPTIASLEFLQQFDSADAALVAAADIGVPPVILPRLRLDDAGRFLGVSLPGDPDYDTLT